VARVQQLVARRYGVSQVLIVLAAVDAYELLRYAIEPDRPLAVEHAHEIASLERALHLAWEAPLQAAFLQAPQLVQALNVFYLGGSFVLTGAFFCWLYRATPAAFRRYRNAFIAATAGALAVHAAFPTAPPRLAGLGLVDTLRTLSGIEIGSVSNPFAAMPSLHAGWALGVGVGLVGHARSRRWRVAGAVYPLFVTLTILVTGNHFVLDALAGCALMTAALVLTGQRHPREPVRAVEVAAAELRELEGCDLAGNDRLQRAATSRRSSRRFVLSRPIVTTLLRGGLGFSGVVISDALEAPGPSSRPDAAAPVIEAGVDVLLYTSAADGEAAAAELVAGGEAGRISTAELNRVNDPSGR